MVRRWVCGVVVVAVVFGSLGWPVLATAKQPSDYIGDEFRSGEIGSFIGLLMGGTGGYVLETLRGLVDGLDISDPNIGPLLLGGLLGLPIGAGLGVSLEGQAKGVEGNVALALVGAFVGTVSGFAFLPLVLVAPAALAVAGYNVGAKMKDTGQPASLPWTLDLPLLSLEF